MEKSSASAPRTNKDRRIVFLSSKKPGAARQAMRSSWHRCGCLARRLEAGSGWFADYPAASSFINLLSCSSAPALNLGGFCDRAVDAKMRRALRLQERDPAAANESWAEIDRALTDRALWVFLYTLHNGDFVSKRVGNYQHHPLWVPSSLSFGSGSYVLGLVGSVSPSQ